MQVHTTVYFPFAPTWLSLQSSSIQVANLACSISNNEEGVKLVRMAATQIDSLCPQVSLIHFVSKAHWWPNTRGPLQSGPLVSPCLALPLSLGCFKISLSLSKRISNCPRLQNYCGNYCVFHYYWLCSVWGCHLNAPYLFILSQLNSNLIHGGQELAFYYICAK